jgi:glycosyltransferase involved in cell wall biosynthesis
MKILFVYSNNGNLGSSIVLSQARSLKEMNIDLDYYPIDNKGFFGYIKHILILRSYLRNSRFSIIHAHYGLCGLVALFSRKREKIIVSFMGDDLLGSTGNHCEVTLFSKILIMINTYFSRWFYDISIVKSQEMLKVLKNNKKAIVLPNGVDLEIFKPVEKTLAMQKANFVEDKFNIIFVADDGRKEKNFPLAMNAVRLIKNYASKLHVLKNVPVNDLSYYYSAADVLIMTSFHEGSPNVIKEAMACNCPIVSTDVGDISYVIGNTEGCYITSFDPIDISNKIILAMEFSRDHIRTKGREQLFQLGLRRENIATEIIRIYGSM